MCTMKCPIHAVMHREQLFFILKLMCNVEVSDIQIHVNMVNKI